MQKVMQVRIDGAGCGDDGRQAAAEEAAGSF
jgi:hypothetical protein